MGIRCTVGYTYIRFCPTAATRDSPPPHTPPPPLSERHRSPTLGRRFVSTIPRQLVDRHASAHYGALSPQFVSTTPRQSAAAKRRIRIERPPCAPKSLPPSRQLRPQTPKRPGTRIPTPGWRRGMLIATDDLPCMQVLITARTRLEKTHLRRPSHRPILPF